MGNFTAAPSYIITRKTKAIMTKDSPYYHSVILEGKRKEYSVHKPEQILENSCLIYGSTMKGRKLAAQHILKTNSKIPVPVIPNMGVYMFPTSSAKNKNCVWLSFYQIYFYEQRDERTFIGFYDGTGIYVDTSENTLNMQYKKTCQVISQLIRPSFFNGKGI